MTRANSPEPPAALALTIDPAALRGLIAEVVRQVLDEVDADRRAVPEGRLAFDEGEAAKLLGLNRAQLRDERLRGRIAASSIVGRRVRYLRQDLLAYLAARRVNDPCEDCRPAARRRKGGAA